MTNFYPRIKSANNEKMFVNKMIAITCTFI